MVTSSTLHVSRVAGCSRVPKLVMWCDLWDRLLSMNGGQRSAEIMSCVLRRSLHVQAIQIMTQQRTLLDPASFTFVRHLSCAAHTHSITTAMPTILLDLIIPRLCDAAHLHRTDSMRRPCSPTMSRRSRHEAYL